MSLDDTSDVLSKRWVTLTLTLILSFSFLSFHYGDVLSSPNSFLFSSDGDGIKNYYTYIYHIDHDPGYLDFSGMNHPYGDKALYTDGNPLLSAFVKALSNSFPGISSYSIGIYNSSLLLSMLLTAVLISLVFFEAGVAGVVNAFFSLAVLSMGPQIFRLIGHYTLAYAWVIPLGILYFLAIRRTQRPRLYGLVMFLGVTIMLFTHPYLGIMSAGLVLVALLIEALIKKTSKSPTPAHSIQTLLVTIVPIVFYLAFTKLTDQVSGRGTLPWGFYDFFASPATVLMPSSGPTHSLWLSILEFTGLEFPHQNWSGLAYIGLSSIIIGFVLIIRIFKKKGPHIPIAWRVLFASAIIFLIFSFCLPFKFGGIFYWLADQFAFVRQFRALGRFAWPFFYVASIGSLVYLWLSVNTRGPLLKWGLPLAAVVLMFVESTKNHTHVSEKISTQSNLFTESDLPATLDLKRFEAILTLPYFMVGTDYYTKDSDGALELSSFLLSYHSALPQMSSKMGRTSITQTLTQTQLYEPGVIHKTVSEMLPDNSEFIVLADPDKCTEHESRILNRCERFGEYRGHALYTITKDALFEDEVEAYLEKACTDHVFHDLGVYSNAEEGTIKMNSFEESDNSDPVLEGTGSLRSPRKNFMHLEEIEAGTFKQGEKLDLTIWVHGDLNSNEGILIVSEDNEETGGEEWTYVNGLNRFIATRGQWHLAQLSFESKYGGAMKFLIKGPDYAQSDVVADRLLIRPRSMDVYEFDENGLHLNNLPICSSKRLLDFQETLQRGRIKQ